MTLKKKKENKLNIGMMIKNLRGSMAKYILSNKINNLDQLKDFNDIGFKYSEVDSTANNFFSSLNDKKNVVVQIPCLNEEASVGNVIKI